MTPRPSQEQIEALFDAALGIDDDEARMAFVRVQADDNEPLAQAVRALLEAHDQARGFLQTSASGNQLTVRSAPELKEGPGSVIGRYKLLQKIGEGGFGAVYMAEQEMPVRRRVALKIIKLGMDTRQVIARFEAERQALAMMDHPNIARVLDAGSTESGRPYFVMELVRGITITNYCDQENLPTHERLKLFISVCQAIQHAHSKGIIHRDIKPSNVMVTLHDGHPVPKVIDFGVAKATQHRLTEKTLFTQYEQFIGTPAYMSPEQAEMSGLDVDTRTDVYALGVLLYELLVGRTPFDAKELLSGGYEEIRRRIREDEPSKPSTKLATLQADDRTDVARHRGSDPVNLTKAVQGDLDWIVMTAMEKERQRRYETPSALAKDVRRFLRHEAVEARPPSLVYRLGKCVRRYRVACLVGGIALISIVSGLLLAIMGLTQARSSWRESERNLERSRENERLARAEQARADENAAEVQRLVYPSLLAAAQDAIRDGRRGRAEELLAMCPDESRNWEWRWVRKALVEPTQIYRGHEPTQCVNDVGYDAEGKHLISAGEDGVVSRWQIQTGERLTSFEGHEGPVFLARPIPNSRFIASAGADLMLRVSDAANEIGHGRGSDQPIQAVAMTRGGDRILTASQNGAVVLWSHGLQEKLATMQGSLFDVEDLAIGRNHVGAVTRSGRLILWQSEGARICDIQTDGLGFDSLTFSPDGETIATGDQDGRVTLWSFQGEQKLTWKGHRRSVAALAFSPDGNLLLSGGWEGGVALRQTHTGEELAFLLTKDAHVHAAAFAPDGRSIAVAGQSGFLAHWNLSSLAPSERLIGHRGLVFEVVTTPDGRYWASVGADGTLRLWDAQTNVEIRRLRGGPGGMYSVDVSPDGKHLVTRGGDGKLRLWELPSGRLLWERPIDYRVRNVRFSPSGLQLAAGAHRESARPRDTHPTIALWDVSQGKEFVRLTGHRHPVMRMDFHPDGGQLVTTEAPEDGAGKGRALVWELSSASVRLSLQPEEATVANVALWSSDGMWLYTGHGDGKICFWNAASGELIRTVYAHGERVGALELSEDGNRLLSCAWYSSEVKLWHSQTGELQLGLDTGIPGVSDVGFDHDDKAILVAGMDGGLRRFPLDWEEHRIAQDLLTVERLASDVRHLENDLYDGKAPQDNPFIHPDRRREAYQKGVQDLMNTHERLHQHATHGSVATPSRHQVAATSLDRLVEKCYGSRRFDEALWINEQALSLLATPDREARQRWIQETREFLDSSPITSIPNPERLAGVYEEREFFVREGQLIYRHRDFGNEWPLIPLPSGKFLVRGDETTQIEFVADGSGETPTAVMGHYFSGGQDRSLRSNPQ